MGQQDERPRSLFGDVETNTVALDQALGRLARFSLAWLRRCLRRHGAPCLWQHERQSRSGQQLSPVHDKPLSHALPMRYQSVPGSQHTVPIGTKSRGDRVAARQTSQRPVTRDDESSVRQRVLSAAFKAFTERGYSETSTIEIATRARVSKRALYSLFGNKQEMLAACISERAWRLTAPVDLSDLRDRGGLARALNVFGSRLLSETSDPVVIAVLRLAISEAVRAPDV